MEQQQQHQHQNSVSAAEEAALSAFIHLVSVRTKSARVRFQQDARGFIAESFPVELTELERDVSKVAQGEVAPDPDARLIAEAGTKKGVNMTLTGQELLNEVKSKKALADRRLADLF